MNTWEKVNSETGEWYKLKVDAIRIRIGRVGPSCFIGECVALGWSETIRNGSATDCQLIAAQLVYEELERLSRALPNLRVLAYPEAPLTHDQIKAIEA